MRAARVEDMAAVAEIYGHYVLHSHATFELTPPPVQAWEHHLSNDVEHGPYQMFVAFIDGRVVGYAKTGKFRERAAYDPSVEVSVYCAHDVAGRGIGTALYDRLLSTLPGDFHRAYAGIALPNAPSIALHERFGFTLAGTFREVGRKFDRWWDVSWFEKELT